MDFTNDERFDGLYLNVAQTTRGIDPLLDTVFSFLRRKTDFFNGPNGQGTEAAIAKVNEVLQKHVDIHNKAQEKVAKKKVKKQPVKPKPVPKEDDDVIELGTDGFDISKTESSSSAPKVEKKITPKDQVKDEPAPVDKIEDSKDSEGDGIAPSIGNGGTVEGKYVWTQTLSELNVIIPLPENTRGRDLNVVIKKNHLKAALKGSSESIVDSALSNAIICDDSFWTVEDGNRLVVSLQKLNQMEWWPCVCKGDPEIDVKKVQPENSKLDDLDGETRQTVEKMMFDQRQKAMGLPTSDEQRKFEALERFKKQHPEMDFSNAKIS